MSTTPAAATAPRFEPVERCWICDSTAFEPMHTAYFDHRQFAEVDPPLATYSDCTVEIARCLDCGFGQPRALPALPDYFERLYGLHWSADWMEAELQSSYKDLIFHHVLDGLEARVPVQSRTHLDIGAHVGRLIHLARQRGWRPEGIELNPRTAAFAARATGLTVHRKDAATLAEGGGGPYGAITLIDVLEHIPEPLKALRAARRLLVPGGWIAVKVPHGRVQLLKERWRGRLRRGYRPALATNLVHVNQFGPTSLRRGLERAGFSDVSMTVGAPELPPGGARAAAANLLRKAVWRASRLDPRGPESPLALHLLAYARAG